MLNFQFLSLYLNIHPTFGSDSIETERLLVRLNNDSDPKMRLGEAEFDNILQLMQADNRVSLSFNSY